MELGAGILLLGLFSALSFWQGSGRASSVLWLLTGAMSIMTGFFFFDMYADWYGMGFGIIGIAYALYCIGHAFATLFGRRDGGE